MASTVYTESVVTLNASQAEATINALKSQADDLRKKMIEATKIGDTESAAKYQKQLDAVNKSMQGIKKETKDYSDIMKKLNGATLNELAKAYSGLNKQIKNLVPGTKEFVEKSKQLKQVKARMDEINASTKGFNKTLNGLKGMLPNLGLAAVFAAAAKAVVQFAKDAISQTQLVGDKWRQFTHGLKNAYGSFVTDLSSGKGWRELIQNMRDSFKVGKEVEAMLDEIFERQNSLTLTEAEYNSEIERNKQIMRDTSKTAQERIAAANEVIRLEKELAAEKKSIAEQEAAAYKEELQQRTKMTDKELEDYIQNYNHNITLTKQAEEYAKTVEDYNKRIAATKKVIESLYEEGWETDTYDQKLAALESGLANLQATTSETVKSWVTTMKKYETGNDEMVDKYVKALAKAKNADAEFYRSTTRATTTISSLRKELSKDAQTAQEAAYKSEIKGVEDHQAEMTIKAKQAYADGTISEQEYQNRLVAIQETALKSKLAINERYKKETLSIQSQLLDLTIKQQEDFKKILSDWQAETDKIIKEMSDEAEEDLKTIMAEIDADFDRQMQHLLDMVDQADEVRKALDPKTALGIQMQAELDSLSEIYENKLLSEEEYQKAKQQVISRYMQENLQMEMEHWMKGMDAAQSYINEVGNAVSALQEMQMTQLDAQMQAELTAAGDNAEKREQIEANYEKKKLETQKKYAVADMVINIAKTLAAGALAVMQAFAQLGPIAGAVMAGIIGVTTAAEVATIVAQKNAIMNTSASSSGGGSTTEARIPTGYSSGGFTKEASNDYQEVGVVHANEWVAPASMVRANPIVFARLEHARKRGTSISGVAGFADGGMTTSRPVAASALSGIDPAILRDLTTVLTHIIENGLHAYVVTSELNAKQQLEQIIKKITGKQ